MPDPTDFSNVLALNTVSADHDARSGYDGVYDSVLSTGETNEELLRQFGELQAYIEENGEAYLNRTTAASTSIAATRVISRVGRDDLFALGLTSRGVDQPLFTWYAPRTADGIQPFTEDIKFIVNHSFGRGFDEVALRAGQRTVAIDRYTGHNSSRFFSGIRGLTSTGGPTRVDACTPSRAGAHHFISLRGDLVNAVPWSSQCLHGEGSGGLYPGLSINERSIGIQHEEWYAFPAGATSLVPLRDQGPYNEAVYAVNAFILKKLETYTGNNFKNYLGFGDTARQNIQNSVVGCFNHSDTSNHTDPGAEFGLPPDYELRVTDLSSIPETRDNVELWQNRINAWYIGIPDGTLISAYARIFAIASRLRNFNLQTEIFDASLEANLVGGPTPTTTASGLSGAAQASAIFRSSGIERAARLTRTTRATLYSSANDSAATVATALAARAAQLTNLANRTLTLPVIQNALGFDFTTGLWTNANTVSRTSSTDTGTTVVDPASSETTPDTASPARVPDREATEPASSAGILMYGSSSTASTSSLIDKLNETWTPYTVAGAGVVGYTARRLLSVELPNFAGYGAIVLYIPGINGVDRASDIIQLTQRVTNKATTDNNGNTPTISWALPPRWPTTATYPPYTDPVNPEDLDRRKAASDRQAELLVGISGLVFVNTTRVQLLATDFNNPVRDVWRHPNPGGYLKIAQTWTRPTMT